MGEDDADETAEMLQASVEGTLRGEEAAEAYEADPDSMAFDCYFHDGIATLHFDGITVTGTAQDGAEVFSHEYEYLCYSPIVDFYVFRTADENLRSARELAPYTEHVHVFNWDGPYKYPLIGASGLWRDYLSQLGGGRCLLLEFMPDGRPESLPAEADALRRIAALGSAADTGGSP